MDLTPQMFVYTAGLWTGAVIDFRTARLPNWLTFSMMALGVAIWGSAGDPLFALKGLAIATAIHFPLFALGVVRAGDAKLVMGAAALVGWAEAIDLTAWYALIYIPVGLMLLVTKRRLGNLAKAAQKLAGAQGEEVEFEVTQLRTGPVIAVAGMMAAFTDVFNFA